MLEFEQLYEFAKFLELDSWDACQAIIDFCNEKTKNEFIDLHMVKYQAEQKYADLNNTQSKPLYNLTSYDDICTATGSNLNDLAAKKYGVIRKPTETDEKFRSYILVLENLTNLGLAATTSNLDKLGWSYGIFRYQNENDEMFKERLQSVIIKAISTNSQRAFASENNSEILICSKCKSSSPNKLDNAFICWNCCQ